MNKYKALLKLREDLNGECSGYCPAHVDSYLDRAWPCSYLKTEWTCEDCEKYFYDLEYKYPCDCPCQRGTDPKELFLRLDEVIEILKEVIDERPK